MRLIKNLAVFAFLGGIAWYAYSQLAPPSSEGSDFSPKAEFNCRRALTELAEDYKCRDSSSCELTSDELRDLKQLEADIDRECN